MIYTTFFYSVHTILIPDTILAKEINVPVCPGYPTVFIHPSLFGMEPVIFTVNLFHPLSCSTVFRKIIGFSLYCLPACSFHSFSIIAEGAILLYPAIFDRLLYTASVLIRLYRRCIIGIRLPSGRNLSGVIYISKIHIYIILCGNSRNQPSGRVQSRCSISVCRLPYCIGIAFCIRSLNFISVAGNPHIQTG